MHRPAFGTYSEITSAITLRPSNFSDRYVAAKPTPYSFSSKHQPTLAGGVLNVGQPVWLEPSVPHSRGGNRRAYADQLGFILLDSRWLLRKDALDASPMGCFAATLVAARSQQKGCTMRPAEYSKTFVVMQDVAYNAIDEDGSHIRPPRRDAAGWPPCLGAGKRGTAW